MICYKYDRFLVKILVNNWQSKKQNVCNISNTLVSDFFIQVDIAF